MIYITIVKGHDDHLKLKDVETFNQLFHEMTVLTEWKTHTVTETTENALKTIKATGNEELFLKLLSKEYKFAIDLYDLMNDLDHCINWYLEKLEII